MPVVIDAPACPAARRHGTLTIGLLNNLGDAGMAMGERQWIDLLDCAAGTTRIALRLFSLAAIARGPRARARMSGLYRDAAALTTSHLDGLIVTGAEPSASHLRDEPFWSDLAAVIDWARVGTRSTIWSCLAAHAAVLHLDGIERRRLPAKFTGIFDASRVGDHAYLADAPQTMPNCHSRWNGLDARELAAAGYTMLTQVGNEADAFLRDEGSLFVFLQGHPEYDDGALGRELRRDLARWRATSDRAPSIPANYLDRRVETTLRAQIEAGHVDIAGSRLTAARAGKRPLALALGRSWLTHLSAAPAQRASARQDQRTMTLVPTGTRP